ncbi:unnamed protein product [Lymnaea stagnalis]|uniref:Hexosyltransferase n=1 Tax=Lymnaea stagnalis TaxID=6523 RepID=A0AAV2IFP1_LYMST
MLSRVVPTNKVSVLLISFGCVLLIVFTMWQLAGSYSPRIKNFREMGLEIPTSDAKSRCPGCFAVEYDVTVDLPALCLDGDVKLIIVIHVNAEKMVARDVIRNTWLAAVRQSQSFRNIRYFFLLGRPETDAVREGVQVESELYQDIVMYEFVDSYKNLTVKTVIAMQWISSRCPNAKFFFKTDDDVWVNVTNLISVIDRNKIQLEYGLGGVCRSVPVVRNKSSKWHATFAEFPKDVYDPYCSGTGYVGGIAVAKGVAHVYTQVPYFHLEDVFVGMCLNILGYNTIFLKGFDNTGGPGLDTCALRERGYVTAHKVSLKRMIEIFRQVC